VEIDSEQARLRLGLALLLAIPSRRKKKKKILARTTTSSSTISKDIREKACPLGLCSLMAATVKSQFAKDTSIVVEKPIPVDLDLGLLAAFDINPLPDASPETLKRVAREGAQLLLNGILSCPISTTKDGVLISLPEIITRLPREKPVPTEQAESKWEKFARLKGIKAKRREGNLIFDEQTEEWVPKWGYKGANKTAENAWLVEMDDNKFAKSAADGTDPRAELRAERKAKGQGKNDKARKLNEAGGISLSKIRSVATKGKANGKVVKRSRRK
jgi:regulator of ribosome biosynthesis